MQQTLSKKGNRDPAVAIQVKRFMADFLCGSSLNVFVISE